MSGPFHVDVSTEIPWAAGLFEGEGSISLRGDRPGKLQLKMITEGSVRRFGAAMGVGKVYGPYGPYKAQPDRSPFYIWVAEGANGAAAARLMVDHVSEPWRCRLLRIIARHENPPARRRAHAAA